MLNIKFDYTYDSEGFFNVVRIGDLNDKRKAHLLAHGLEPFEGIVSGPFKLTRPSTWLPNPGTK